MARAAATGPSGDSGDGWRNEADLLIPRRSQCFPETTAGITDARTQTGDALLHRHWTRPQNRPLRPQKPGYRPGVAPMVAVTIGRTWPCENWPSCSLRSRSPIGIDCLDTRRPWPTHRERCHRPGPAFHQAVPVTRRGLPTPAVLSATIFCTLVRELPRSSLGIAQ